MGQYIKFYTSIFDTVCFLYIPTHKKIFVAHVLLLMVLHKTKVKHYNFDYFV